MFTAYPALRAKMGNWEYFIIKMQMKKIVEEVGFASQIYENKTLDEAIQRELREGRVKKEIVKYLGHRNDRFFSSIVVAALEGNPKFFPVEITDDPRFEMLKAGSFDDAFGVLTFDGGQRYYALDGQHRLKAIKTLIEQDESGVPSIPEGFLEEEISVIMLVRKEEDQDEFLKQYRRIFSSLNRYAKATNQDTNIIMDEDDSIAILTRRLLVDHSFFKWEGTPEGSPKLKTKGDSMKSGDPQFTTLRTLYKMNETLLLTAARERVGFCSKEDKQFRRPEDELDELFEELKIYWDSLLQEIDILNADPAKMREHTAAPTATDIMDNLLFWPIGQVMFAELVRLLLNRRLPDPDSPEKSVVQECIAPLAQVNWNLHKVPWKGLLIVKEPIRERWNMRNEDRKGAVEVAKRILRVQLGLDDLSEEELGNLKTDWHAMLIPRPSDKEVDADWELASKKIASARGINH